MLFLKVSKYAEFYADFHGHNEKVTAPKKRGVMMCYDEKTEFIKFSFFFRKFQKNRKFKKKKCSAKKNRKHL